MDSGTNWKITLLKRGKSDIFSSFILIFPPRVHNNVTHLKITFSNRLRTGLQAEKVFIRQATTTARVPFDKMATIATQCTTENLKKLKTSKNVSSRFILSHKISKIA